MVPSRWRVSGALVANSTFGCAAVCWNETTVPWDTVNAGPRVHGLALEHTRDHSSTRQTRWGDMVSVSNNE